MWQNLGKGSEAWIFALDAMVNVKENKQVDDAYLKGELDKAAKRLCLFKKLSRMKPNLLIFQAWTANWKKPFTAYANSENYENVKKIIEESVEKNKSALVFHESNSCPEFWENTRPRNRT